MAQNRARAAELVKPGPIYFRFFRKFDASAFSTDLYPIAYLN